MIKTNRRPWTPHDNLYRGIPSMEELRLRRLIIRLNIRVEDLLFGRDSNSRHIRRKGYTQETLARGFLARYED
jgi:hypothetical protein